MILPELLCPAGDEAALKAAVDTGADAVYLGCSRFGARASAVNFDEEALERAVNYAHLYHTRVYVTVNTLVKQNEIDGVRDTLRMIETAGADAVITQDIGVAALTAREFPRLALHASTQMALMNATDAAWAKAQGFTRVVLARECSLEDIRKVAATGIETEVFVHGALCTAVSGRCLMSSMAGGRSGNRGRCAQPCRQCYSLGSRTGALLSTRDLCLIDVLPALCKAGVASLKIEGRLKSPEYVAVVTSAYRRVLDDIGKGTFHAPNAETRRELLQIFNRGGFTRGHAMGAEDAALCDASRVNHRGVPIGVVESARNGFANIRLSAALNDGDSLRICGAKDMELRYSGNDVGQGQTAKVRLRQGDNVRAGDAVVRLADSKQLEAARAHAPKPIAVTMNAELTAGKPMKLTISDGESEACVFGSPVELAQKSASTEADVRKQLEKLGNTPFVLANADNLTVAMEEGLFLPVAALNALRRDAVQTLIENRIRRFGESGRSNPHMLSAEHASRKHADIIDRNTLAVVFSDASLAQRLSDAGATMFIYEPNDICADAVSAAIDALPDGVWLKMPRQASESSLQELAALVRRYSNKLGGAVLGSIGQLALSLPVPVVAGDGVPVCNCEAITVLENTPFMGFTLWNEWTKDELDEMKPFAITPLLKVYGYEPLMLLNHCPERAARGLDSNRKNCALCKNGSMACGMGKAELADRMGHRFPIQRIHSPEGCILRLLNSLPTLINDEPARNKLGAGALMHFTIEPSERQIELVSAFSGLMRGEPDNERALGAEPSTLGHWRRKVE